MNNDKLKLFVGKIMSINATYTSGEGGAAAGVTGSAGMGDPVIHQLKRTAIDFASEYHKVSSDSESLTELSDKIEGLLQTLRALSDISSAKFEELIGDLQSLMSNSPADE